jgi:transposase
LREVFNGVRYIVKSGAHWRLMPHDFPLAALHFLAFVSLLLHHRFDGASLMRSWN